MALAWYFGNNVCPVCNNKSLIANPRDYTIRCNRCQSFMQRQRFFERVVVWTRNKSAWWRVPIIIYFLYLLHRNLGDPFFAMHRGSNLFSFINFGIHELGHFLFMPLGEFWAIAGGSIFQCVFPLLWIAGFIQIRYYFASTLCLAWLGLNFFDVATYAADARSRTLPLASLGSDYDTAHDWYQLLSRTGRLEQDQLIAGWLRVAGTASMLLGCALAAALLGLMLYQKRLARIERDHYVH